MAEEEAEEGTPSRTAEPPQQILVQPAPTTTAVQPT
jgi:hypothetical protein